MCLAFWWFVWCDWFAGLFISLLLELLCCCNVLFVFDFRFGLWFNWFVCCCFWLYGVVWIVDFWCFGNCVVGCCFVWLLFVRVCFGLAVVCLLFLRFYIGYLIVLLYFDSFFVNFVFDCIVYLYLVIFGFLYSDCLVVGLMFIVVYWFGFGLMCYLVCWWLFVRCDCFVISTVYCWLTWGVCFGMLSMFECFVWFWVLIMIWLIVLLMHLYVYRWLF